MSWEVRQADCVEAMREMDEASVDAIVTDPPYGLEFMGKEWDRLDHGLPQEAVWKGRRGKGGSNIGTDDSKPASRHHVALGVGKRHQFKRCVVCGKRQFSGSPCECDEPEWEIETPPGTPSSSIRAQRWHQAWATEALRVLKPGGHLLAFGGTRTYHRLACAVEDAGFEIRDSVIWLYGSGFPKSLAVDKAIDRADDSRRPERERLGRWLREQREAAGLKQKEVAVHWPSETGGLTGCVANWEGGFNCPTLEQWVELKRIIGLPDDMDAEVWRLNGRKGKPGKNWEKREKIGTDSRTASESWLGTQDGEKSTWGIGEWDVTGPRHLPECDETSWENDSAAKHRLRSGAGRCAPGCPVRWQGWGTALKPAHEPIVVARKPLVGTVAQTVSEFGTGALNVGGCRIEHQTVGSGNLAENTHLRKSIRGGEGFTPGLGTGAATREGETNPAGRWPANVTLSHLPECERVGERRVKGSPKPYERSVDADGGVTGWNSEKAGDYVPGYADPDGLETVEAWACAENCPVRELDRQSGESISRSGGERTHATDGLLNRNANSAFRAGAPPVPRGGHDDTGGASRFFLSVQGDRLCVLCGLPCVESVGNPSPPSEAPSDTALSGAQGSQPPESEGKSARSKAPAPPVESSLRTTPETTASTAPSDASQLDLSRSDPSARSATNLCGSCETAIAQSVARWRQGQTSESAAGPASMPERGRQILIQSLALIAADPASIDITTTIRHLSALLGSALGATPPVIPTSETGTASDLTRWRYQAKSSRAERNAGLDGFEERRNLPDNPRCGACGRQRVGALGAEACGCAEPRWAANREMRNVHPTVKPVDLMRWLCRLVTPPGGVCLDPFTGSGTTGIAAVLEGFDFIGIEREAEYVQIAKARIAWWEAHQGRETDEVLAVSRRSEALRAEHEASGQLGLGL